MRLVLVLKPKNPPVTNGKLIYAGEMDIHIPLEWPLDISLDRDEHGDLRLVLEEVHDGHTKHLCAWVCEDGGGLD